MVLKGDGEYESQDETETAAVISDEEVTDYPETGELLVTRRALSTLFDPETIQRENIFHTRCSIDHKVCSLIIDGCSCTNVASKYLVDKLGLVKTAHPRPYRLKWFNDETELKIAEQVVVSFGIGKYHDQVKCDVVPMQAGHILLGRPWQFDKETLHHGRTNIYSFTHHNKKHSLAPLSPQEVHDMQKAMAQSSQEGCFAGFEAPEVPDVVQDLMGCYKDVFPDEIPAGLPPVRGIEHQIDLGLKVDEENIKAIEDWPTPTTIGHVGSFHGLASFYRRFVKDFSTLAASMTFVIKKNVSFTWGPAQEESFNRLKYSLTHAPVLTLPDFDKPFEIECDASGTGIGATTLKKRHARWLDFVETFPYVIKYKKGKDNVVADALSRRHTLITTMEAKILGFEQLKMSYETDRDFSELYSNTAKGAMGPFFQQDGFLFKEKRPCIPHGSMRDLLTREAHGGGLMGNFGRDKTLSVLSDHFYWPRMRRYVESLCAKCTVYLKTKSRSHPYGLHMPLPIPIAPWVDLSMDFVHSITNLSPFEIVYGFRPETPMDLSALPPAMQETLEKKAEWNRIKLNKGRTEVIFQPGDWVWLHMRPERFPEERKSKLFRQGDRPFRVLDRINDNAYRLELPDDRDVLRTEPVPEGGDVAVPTTEVTIIRKGAACTGTNRIQATIDPGVGRLKA
ncbi:uncharacterized protein LOC125590446 [Brassica napus]|uniref:uncharacterized protein LOC125590446 n=1 Tax=Brassica napus TaxID=3708 RepID=UPI00207A2686|nr:uncharacterized protein LOC125590446 [Brassica napus]